MEAHFYQRFVLEASPATEAAAAAAAQGGGGAVAKVVTTPRSAMLAVRKTLAMAEGAQRQLLDPTGNPPPPLPNACLHTEFGIQRGMR